MAPEGQNKKKKRGGCGGWGKKSAPADPAALPRARLRAVGTAPASARSSRRGAGSDASEAADRGRVRDTARPRDSRPSPEKRLRRRGCSTRGCTPRQGRAGQGRAGDRRGVAAPGRHRAKPRERVRASRGAPPRPSRSSPVAGRSAAFLFEKAELPPPPHPFFFYLTPLCRSAHGEVPFFPGYRIIAECSVLTFDVQLRTPADQWPQSWRNWEFGTSTLLEKKCQRFSQDLPV